MLPCCLSHTSSFRAGLWLDQGCFIIPFHAHPSHNLLKWLALPAGSICSSGQPLTRQMLMQSWSWWEKADPREVWLLSKHCPTCSSLGLLSSCCCWGYGEELGLPSFPYLKTASLPPGWMLELSSSGGHWGGQGPSSQVDKPAGRSCVSVPIFLVPACCLHAGKTPSWDWFPPLLEMRSAGGEEEGTKAVLTCPISACSQQKILSPARSCH